MPVMFGSVVGVVLPGLMMIVDGEMVSVEGSLLVRVMVTPWTPAGEPRVTAYGAVVPRFTLAIGGMLMPVGGTTFTLKVVLVMSGLLALAVMVAEPLAMLVTGTVTTVLFAGIVTVDGTVATPVLLDVSTTVSAVGGAEDRFNVTF